jgi:hypothetical protein
MRGLQSEIVTPINEYITKHFLSCVFFRFRMSCESFFFDCVCYSTSLKNKSCVDEYEDHSTPPRRAFFVCFSLLQKSDTLEKFIHATFSRVRMVVKRERERFSCGQKGLRICRCVSCVSSHCKKVHADAALYMSCFKKSTVIQVQSSIYSVILHSTFFVHLLVVVVVGVALLFFLLGSRSGIWTAAVGSLLLSIRIATTSATLIIIIITIRIVVVGTTTTTSWVRRRCWSK